MESMYMFPPHRERKRNNIFTAWNQVCFYEKQTPLQYLHVLFFSFHLFSPVVKRVGLY